jgi:Na+/melibiose symporter-like transporter
MKDYANILKNNKEIRWLMLSSGFNKLASTIATSGTIAFLIFGCLMGNYNGLFVPFYILCFIFMGLFLMWGNKTAGTKGQKRGVVQFSFFAILFYIGVLVLLLIYSYDNPATHLSLFSTKGGFKITINLYTILFIIFYGCGYGAFNCCDQMTIPMIADCTDYETYRSGKYVPGIMGTLFSFVDKIISSFQVLILQVFIVYMVPGLNALPGEATPYLAGMKLSAIICFCVLPMIAWLITLVCMYFYKLSGSKLKEVQAVNAVRKAAIAGGMNEEEAMKKWVTIDQVPTDFIPIEDKRGGKTLTTLKENILDKVYKKIWGKREQAEVSPSINAVPIPDEFKIK